MKTKKLLSVFVGILLFSPLMALNHGSEKGMGLPIYPIRDGAAPGTAVAGVTFDYKIVTIGTTTWAWTNWHGQTIAGNAWSSQLRYWTPAKVENNLLGRITGTQQTYGTATGTPPATITFLQEDNNAFFETADIAYNSTIPNSADPTDTEKPALAAPVTTAQTATSLQLTFSATDNSGDYFYYITDADNNYKNVVFTNTTTIPLTQGTNYNFSIYAVDFSGNISDPQTVTVTGQTFECNNLMQNSVLSIGTVYYAPNWAADTNYTASFNNGTLSISLTDATFQAWQAQFPLLVQTPVAVTPGKVYSLTLNATLTVNTPVYVKFYDANDNQFMEIPKQTYNAGTNALGNFEITCPDGLTQISKILFDFGGNAAASGITISDISLCGDLGTGFNNLIQDKMSVSQVKNEILIRSENEIITVSLFDVTGHAVSVKCANNTIDTSNLTEGLYLLNLADVSGNVRTFKVFIK